jgi:hypothetical protein
MKKTLLGATLMIVAAVMMGCGDIDTFAPCTLETVDEDCTLDIGWGGNSAAWDGPQMVCNTDVSPREKCEEMFGWLPPMPFPIPIPLPIPDCSELSDDPGVCEIDFGLW